MTNQTLTLITTSFPISGDGSEAAGSFVADLVEEIAKKITVHVVAPGLFSTVEEYSDTIKIFRYAAPSKPLSTLKPWLLKDLATIAKVIHSGRQATRLAANGSNHLLALWGLPCGEWARKTSKETGIPYSVWMLGSDIWTLGRIPLLRGVLSRVIQSAAYAYADGYQLAEDARQLSGRSIEFLPSTRRIEHNHLEPPHSEEPYRLLFLGRWHPNKGIDILLDALELLSKDDWKRIEYIEIQGGGPLEKLVKEKVLTLRSMGYPVILGQYLSKSEAEAAIARADWLLIPSRIESIPVVFSDAMKLGRSVISMPTGDLPRLVGKEKTGILATNINATSFGVAIHTALNTKTSDFTLSIDKQAGKFDLQQLAQNLIKKMKNHV